MIRRITGDVIDSTANQVVVECAGVGYLIYVRHGADFVIDAKVQLWTHLAVRETALDLYGFVTRDELAVFELLLTLPKVGPKSALQILAQADIALLKQAVAQQDATYLSKMSGIGKKTAEKIVLELKDKLADLYSGDTVAGAYGTGPTSPSSHQTDLIDALLTLGYSDRDARDAARQVPADITNTSDAIKLALQQLQ